MKISFSNHDDIVLRSILTIEFSKIKEFIFDLLMNLNIRGFMKVGIVPNKFVRI